MRQKARAALNPKRQQELQGVQRLWIPFRNAKCKFAFDPDGGSRARIDGAECIMTTTVFRATDLRIKLSASQLVPVPRRRLPNNLRPHESSGAVACRMGAMGP